MLQLDSQSLCSSLHRIERAACRSSLPKAAGDGNALEFSFSRKDHFSVLFQNRIDVHYVVVG
jgi:hypothetical protein